LTLLQQKQKQLKEAEEDVDKAEQKILAERSQIDNQIAI